MKIIELQNPKRGSNR